MTPEELNNPQSTNFVSQPPKSSHKKIIILILFFCLFLGVSGYAYFYFTGNNETKTDQNVPSNVSDNRSQGLGSKILFNQEVKSKPAIDSDSVFMLGVSSENSDIDWKTIFEVSSLSKIVPILLVENKNKLDDFSPKLFIQQYSPRKIYTYNYQYSNQNSEKLNADDINAKLYSSSNFVVISNGEDYASSIVAASFAARFNIPIFFTPLKSEERNLIKNWNAKSIGIGVTENIDHALSVGEANNLLKENSDYLILTTSDDLTKTSYSRFSLATPILAGGRDGLILDIKNPTRESVKQAVNQVTKNGFNPAYLVTVGNENNFPFLQFDIIPQGTLYNQDDDHQYFVNLYYWADYNNSNEYVPDASVGAITGYSVSDASSLIARSLFYEKIAKSDKVITW
ncbi:MAG: cell wall-binding repeat-containing protein [Patescibacteria group bacterium]